MTPEPPQTNRGTSKFLVEFGPLLLFFAVNAWRGILWATGALMIAMPVAMVVSYRREGRIPPMTWVTGVTVLVFGGLTVWLRDDVFIKLKVTLVNVLFGSVLVVGHLRGRVFLKSLLGQAFQLSDAGWRALTLRYAAFFFGLAVLNELIWRNVSTDRWVTFKVFGLLGLTLVFSLAQLPLLQRHQAVPEVAPEDEPPA